MRPAPPARRWSTRCCSTRSASFRALPTWRANTGSTASTWAFPYGSARRESRRSSRSTSTRRSARRSAGRRTPSATWSKFSPPNVKPTTARLPSRRMDLGLQGRTAIVSGASSGLGLATAEALSLEGANVTMFARRRDELERESNRLGALAVRGDVTNATDLERLVERTLQAFGGIDILVWNSGGPPPGTASSVTDDQLETAFDLLLAPAIRLVR